ncbi:hypothetical protein NQ318_000490, partial [Aromia moschata]
MKPFTQLFLYTNVVSILFLFPSSFGDALEINRELNQNCTCVPYFQCTDDFGDLITDGAGMLDVSTFRRISNIIVHPEFNKATLHNDIALAILQDPIEVSEKVNTLCIPPHGLVSDNMRCKVTTTVKNLEGHGSYPSMLKVSIVPKETCLKKLRSTRLGSVFQLHRSFLCAVMIITRKLVGMVAVPWCVQYLDNQK